MLQEFMFGNPKSQPSHGGPIKHVDAQIQTKWNTGETYTHNKYQS